jgi:hypothetical protein
MGKPLRRSFDDWVIILSDGLMTILGAVFVVIVVVASIGSSNISFGNNDDDRRR